MLQAGLCTFALDVEAEKDVVLVLASARMRVYRGQLVRKVYDLRVNDDCLCGAYAMSRTRRDWKANAKGVVRRQARWRRGGAAFHRA